MRDSLKNIIKIALTAAFLLLCLLLPPQLIPETPLSDPPSSYWSPLPETESATLFGKRVEIYDEYYEERQIVPSNSIDSVTLEACYRRIAELLPKMIAESYDPAEALSGSNSTVYYIEGDDNRNIRVLEFFLEWTGDWKNWFFVNMDIDTQDIYYLYVSNGCERRFDYYRTQYIPNIDDIIHDLLPSYMGRELLVATQQMYVEGRDYYILSFGPEDDPIAYEVNGFTTFSPDSEVILYDYKIICKSADASSSVRSEKTDA